LQQFGTLVRAFYYTEIIEDQEFTSLRPLTDWLDYNGFTVVAKPAKDFNSSGITFSFRARRLACVFLLTMNLFFLVLAQ